MSKEIKRLRRENERLEAMLSEDAARVQTDIVVYLRVANISTLDQELVRRDITQMILDGEQSGVPVGDTIGGDYKAFCDNVIAEIPKLSAKRRFAASIGSGCLYAAIMLIIWLGGASAKGFIENGSAGFSSLPLTVGDIVGAVLIIAAAVGVVNMMCRNAFDEKATPLWLLILIFVAALAGAVAAELLFEAELFRVHGLSAVIVIAALFGASALISEKTQ